MVNSRGIHVLLVARVEGAMSVHEGGTERLQAFAQECFEFMCLLEKHHRVQAMIAAERLLLERMHAEMSSVSNLLFFVDHHFTDAAVERDFIHIRAEVALTVLTAFCAQLGICALRALVKARGREHKAIAETTLALCHISEMSVRDYQQIRQMLGETHDVYDDLPPLIGTSPHLSCAEKLRLGALFIDKRRAQTGLLPMLLQHHGHGIEDIVQMCVFFADSEDACRDIMRVYVERVGPSYSSAMRVWHAIGKNHGSLRTELLRVCERACDLTANQRRTLRCKLSEKT
ncbi:hypothetical protein CYMTET_47942 [Cymbomonas tetramitiformis]|uniref:Uncharacterized protein n=1 Tax=Cymbomonas tetramitiformis TaxID=36881 RepID=A0AAE0BV14_9CHLO|nr:hypothetical protein CYMTET_47942 [Cymbomonas tetramitiformis]|eukprot:gene1626-2268_t